MVNTGGFWAFTVSIESDVEGGNSCDVKEIAYDGVYLREARTPPTGRSLLSPGTRVDLLVNCDSPGVYQVSGL